MMNKSNSTLKESDLKKIKNALIPVFYNRIPFNASKRTYHDIALKVNLLRTPDLPADPMAPKKKYLKEIFDAFDSYEIMDYISRLVKESYGVFEKMDEGSGVRDKFEKLHKEHLSDLNSVLQHMGVKINEKGEIEALSSIPLKQKIYPPSEAYEFYKDLKNIIGETEKELLIVDSYVNEDLFNLYVAKAPKTANIRILTNRRNASPNFKTVADMFAMKPGIKFEVRTSKKIHDRIMFIDNSCYVFGASIKDAAVKKPTYIIKLDVKEIFDICKKVYEDIWNESSLF